MNIFLILHFIPVIAGFYIYYIIPYFTLKKNSSLYDYFNNLEFLSIPSLTILAIVPIFNYIILFNIVKDYSNDPEKDECLEQTVSNIYDFFKEFLIALWMLIVWLFGLKYIFRFLTKILSFKIK